MVNVPVKTDIFLPVDVRILWIDNKLHKILDKITGIKHNLRVKRKSPALVLWNIIVTVRDTIKMRNKVRERHGLHKSIRPRGRISTYTCQVRPQLRCGLWRHPANTLQQNTNFVSGFILRTWHTIKSRAYLRSTVYCPSVPPDIRRHPFFFLNPVLLAIFTRHQKLTPVERFQINIFLHLLNIRGLPSVLFIQQRKDIIFHALAYVLRQIPLEIFTLCSLQIKHLTVNGTAHHIKQPAFPYILLIVIVFQLWERIVRKKEHHMNVGVSLCSAFQCRDIFGIVMLPQVFGDPVDFFLEIVFPCERTRAIFLYVASQGQEKTIFPFRPLLLHKIKYFSPLQLVVSFRPLCIAFIPCDFILPVDRLEHQK